LSPDSSPHAIGGKSTTRNRSTSSRVMTGDPANGIVSPRRGAEEAAFDAISFFFVFVVGVWH
jgi:hypothetical protein